MGPNFNKGARRIGRDRLPPGVVAIVEDVPLLELAIGEMHEFVVAGKRLESARAGIIFGVVDVGERLAYNWNLQRVTDDVNFFVGDLLGLRHTLDLEHLTHIHHRHSDPAKEELHGQIPLTLEDILLIPQLVQPRNLRECCYIREMCRLVYARRWDHGQLVAVEEIRFHKKELVIVTLYKHQ